MNSILSHLKSKLFPTEIPNETPQTLNRDISLGVLMWEVACADNEFLPQERDSIAQLLVEKASVSPEEVDTVLRSVEIASQDKIDLHSFAFEVKQELNYSDKCEVITHLFHVACADQDLDHEEEELIRKIAGLLGVDHKEFIEAKIAVKKVYGLG